VNAIGLVAAMVASANTGQVVTTGFSSRWLCPKEEIMSKDLKDQKDSRRSAPQENP